MKKLFITIAVVLVSASALSARPTGFNIGGGFGYLGWATNYDNAPVDYLSTYFELGYELKVAKNSYVYFGGRFSHGLHSRGNYYIVGGTASGTAHIGDLFIPIRFQQNFNIGGNSTFYIEAGPAAGFLLYNYAIVAASNYHDGSIVTRSESMLYEGEPRANFYLGGNIGFNINKHCKIYLGGDYGFVPFKVGYDVFSQKEHIANRWQLNLGACYVF